MIYNRKVTALVPIKANSERVKDKNFKDFSGKPLYHHIIETLDKTYSVDVIIMNTDSDRVKEEAPKLSEKIIIHTRPDELVGDFVSVNKLIKFDIDNSESDIYIQTHATNPLLKAETIAKALRKFIEMEDKYDSVFSVNTFYSRFYDSDGSAVNHNPDELLRTQDLPPLYEENSNFYIFTKDSFHKKNKRIGVKPLLFDTPRIESIDIDDEFSFKIAELLAMYAHEQFK